MEDRRYYRRIKFEADAEVIYKDASFKAELYDISLMGALLKSTPPLPVKMNDLAELKIYLPLSEISLNFTAELVHRKEGFSGFKFKSKDVDTITHLRRLLELNIGDDVQINKEIAFWLKGER